MQQPTPELISVDSPLSAMFNVSEIFHSIQGEGTRIGMPCTFVRLQGCKLRCVWCDTPYALDHRSNEQLLNGQRIIDEISKYSRIRKGEIENSKNTSSRKGETMDQGSSVSNSRNLGFIEFSGGEPLEQFPVFSLMSTLCDMGYTVAVETGGHVDVSLVDKRVIKIMDVKCPDSKMMTLNHLENMQALLPHDEVKFVIASRVDYDWAKEIVEEFDLTNRTSAVLMSCAFGLLPYHELAEWILADRLDVRFQPQLHKFIWEPNRRGV